MGSGPDPRSRDSLRRRGILAGVGAGCQRGAAGTCEAPASHLSRLSLDIVGAATWL
jgi:hypothetical protein